MKAYRMPRESASSCGPTAARREGRPFAQGAASFVFAFLSALALSFVARGAAANAAPRSFFEGSRSGVLLNAENNPPLRVARVDIALDFRREGRGRSSSSYRLENESDAPWEDDVLFIASAEDVIVSVDGRPAEARLVKGEIGEPAKGPSRGTWPEGQRVYAFRLALGPRAGCDLRVTFRASPGVVRERLDEERQADGLTRLVSRGDHYRPRAYQLTYPLWPAVGFGGGVGAMHVAILASEGADLRAGNAPIDRRARSKGEVEFRGVVPPAEPFERAPSNLEVRYTLPDPPPLVGASVFAAARVLDADGKGFGANVRASGDLVFFDKFGLSLGAETDFTRTLSGVATLASGSAGAYGSGYIGGGAIVAAKPGVALGLEANAGVRMLVIPLDLAVQVYPYRDTKAQDVGVVRILVGLKFGLLTKSSARPSFAQDQQDHRPTLPDVVEPPGPGGLGDAALGLGVNRAAERDLRALALPNDHLEVEAAHALVGLAYQRYASVEALHLPLELAHELLRVDVAVELHRRGRAHRAARGGRGFRGGCGAAALVAGRLGGRLEGAERGGWGRFEMILRGWPLVLAAGEGDDDAGQGREGEANCGAYASPQRGPERAGASSAFGAGTKRAGEGGAAHVEQHTARTG